MRKTRKLLAVGLALGLALAAAPTASAAYTYTATRYDCSSGVCVKVNTSTVTPSNTGARISFSIASPSCTVANPNCAATVSTPTASTPTVSTPSTYTPATYTPSTYTTRYSTGYTYTYTTTRYDCSSGVCVRVGTPTVTPAQSQVTDVNTNTPVVSPADTDVKTDTPAVSPSGVGVNYTPVSASTQEQQLLAMMNEERAAQGLAPYILDSTYSGVAKVKCQDMIANKYFAHESPTLGSVRDMLQSAGISYRGAGENIARYGSLQKAHAGLMSSIGHRNNILSNTYTHVGLSVCTDASGNVYVVQLFIRK